MTIRQSEPKSVIKIKSPSQERGLVRFNLLLDAAHDLLKDQEVEEIGIYMVAKHAGIPPASAYHFFPTPGSIWMGLAKRYIQQFTSTGLTVEIPTDGRWQTLTRLSFERVAALYEFNPQMRKLFLGHHMSKDVVLCAAEYNEVMAERLVAAHAELFHLPYIRNPVGKYLVLITAVESIWSLSQAKHGCITQEYLEESIDIALSYSRTFFPERIEAKSPPSLFVS